MGDAAVGMRPVTAHGYNLGLAGVESLTATLHAAQNAARDIGDAAVLARYERQHRLHAWPIYQGTNTVVGLFTPTPGRCPNCCAARCWPVPPGCRRSRPPSSASSPGGAQPADVAGALLTFTMLLIAVCA